MTRAERAPQPPQERRQERVKNAGTPVPLPQRGGVNELLLWHVHLRDASSYRLFGALWGSLAVVDVADVLRAPDLVATSVIVVLVAGCSLGVDVITAMATAGTGWLVADGFVVHRYGELGWQGLSSLALVAVLVGASVGASRCAR